MQKRLANVSLGILLGLLIIALILHRMVWAPYLLGLSLAGIAGGIADWYAVTALFRHPLGLKWLPHTSIISANRERIIDALATLVETELLSTDFLNRNIQKLPVTDTILNTLQKPLSGDIQLFFSRTLSGFLHEVPRERLANFLRRFVESKADAIEISDWIVHLIEWLIRSGQDRALYLFLAQHAETALEQVEFTEDMERRLKEMIEQYTKTGTRKFFLGVLESLGTVDYHELSLSVKGGLSDWLKSDKGFEQFELVLVRIMRSVRDDAVVRAKIDEAKKGMLGQVPWNIVVDWAMTEAQNALEGGQAAEGLKTVMGAIHQWLSQELGVQAQMDALVKGLLMRTVTQYHSMIGQLVRDNLREMDERDWIDKLEFYVGQDLQWIRVNGAIVGGLVGLVITILTHL